MDREAFMDFYLDNSDEDPEYIHEYLVKEGIDIDGLQARLLELIAKRKAEQKLVEGKKFKSAYEEMKRKADSIFGKKVSEEVNTTAVAYRKHQGESEEDATESVDDAKKLAMIKQAKESLSNGKKAK
ncbi:MAG: hypothetical protein WAO19_02930 [Candidatus Kryptoniota bacterium]